MRLPTAAASSSRTATTSMTSTKSVIKPGRQTVTFLLVCNLGLWIAYNFEAQKVIILLNFPTLFQNSEFKHQKRRGFQNYFSCFLTMTLSWKTKVCKKFPKYVPIYKFFKVNATPDQVDFYGKMPWILIQRITLPLCVFFRFHSTVVLSELWKNSYRWQN